MNEKTIEAALRDRIKGLGGRAYKFESPGNAGMPDRLICLPGGRVVFAETKSPGKKPTALQRAKHRELEALGFHVFGCVDSMLQVECCVSYCRGLIGGGAHEV